MKLKIENSYCYYTFNLFDNPRSKKPMYTLDRKKDKQIYVTWPNGEKTLEKLNWHDTLQSYGDMGHTYNSRSEAFYIEKELNGIKVHISPHEMDKKELSKMDFDPYIKNRKD